MPGKRGRRRLVGGFRAWLADHRTLDGHIFRTYVKAGNDLLGPHVNGELRKVELHRYAIAGTVFEQHAREWAALSHWRETGKGRRPRQDAVQSAAKRLSLAEQTLASVTARLEALNTQRSVKPSTPSELLDSMRDGHRAETETDC